MNRRLLRYWFETKKKIHRGNLVVLENRKEKRQEFGPWLVASMNPINRFLMWANPLNHALEIGDYQPPPFSNSLAYGLRGFIMGAAEINDRINREIFHGQAQLLLYFDVIAEKGTIGYLIPDPTVVANGELTELAERYSRNGSEDELLYSLDKILHGRIEGHQLPDYRCGVLNGLSNNAYTALDYKLGVCDHKASVLAALASHFFPTRMVGYYDVKAEEWHKLCKEQGVKVTDDREKYLLDRHCWIEVHTNGVWQARDTTPFFVREHEFYPRSFELQRQFGKVYSEFTLEREAPKT